ncbi:MAG: hypothetical protein VW771_01455 [Gammaproteobacteria bacterium]
MNSSIGQDFINGRQWLESLGFNRCAVLDVELFDRDLRDAYEAADTAHTANERLVLLGMAGPLLWQHVEKTARGRDDPFDEYALEVAQAVSQRFWGDGSPRILYPGPSRIPLQQLGRFAGWACASPLGLDISPLYGPWFAYRAAFLTTSQLPFTPGGQPASPCERCESKPCVTACPVGAVQEKGTFGLQSCLTQRLDDPPGCGMRCKSRLACPVGEEHRYSDAQLDYHGQRSFDALRRWSGAKPQ